MKGRASVPGTLLGVLGTGASGVAVLPFLSNNLTRSGEGFALSLLVILAVLVPAPAAILGGWMGKRTLQQVGAGLMGVVSLGWLSFSAWAFITDPFGLGNISLMVGLTTLGIGAVMAMSTFLLRPRQ
ncbi:hypothetical protein [Hyalangium rubrum]|uniref:Major facilitator superfamily (MFS) profile domain-containing protein n=1 Tax=Hyalangium rubrum TaxID=3103134 RepID=A0ABU5GY17_9BACT|nr:hypothetical protein [Hyalangium sp. s54d21]MDY7225432.1 hypothetical protein [Hyalangium sp. s54d21]